MMSANKDSDDAASLKDQGDAWNLFENTVNKMLRTPPQPRKKSAEQIPEREQSGAD